MSGLGTFILTKAGRLDQQMARARHVDGTRQEAVDRRLMPIISK